MPFSQNLIYCMNQRGYSAYRLAKVLGVNNQSTVNWMEGKNVPHPKTRQKIADHFGITVAELDGDELPVLPQNFSENFMVDKIRELCKKNGTSIYKLEKQLGFGNGTIGKWAKAPKSPPYAKLTAVATALGVPVTELTGEAAPAAKKEPAPLDELLPGYARLTEENKRKAQEYIALLLNSQRNP